MCGGKIFIAKKSATVCNSNSDMIGIELISFKLLLLLTNMK